MSYTCTVHKAHLSTTMPARMALATLRNLRRSSPRRRTFVSDLVKVEVNQSLTCLSHSQFLTLSVLDLVKVEVNQSLTCLFHSQSLTFSVLDLVKVEVSQSLTCSGTASLSVTSLSSSSSSQSRLHTHRHAVQSC